MKVICTNDTAGLLGMYVECKLGKLSKKEKVSPVTQFSTLVHKFIPINSYT